MQTFLQDLKHALRMFRESPGFTATAVAALTLGIGVNTAIFSVVNAVILKPLPFDEPDRVVQIVNSRDGNPAGGAASPAKFMHYRAQTDVFEDVAAYRTNSFNYSEGDIPERVTAGQVSEGYFRTFRASVVEGRSFTPEEDLPGAPKTTVISYRFWTQRLGGDPDVIGKTLPLSGEEYTIVGIVGDDFDLREFGGSDLWVPFQLDPNTTDQGHYFSAAGRLKPGMSIEQAQARLEASAAGYRERFPIALQDNQGFSVVSFQDAVVGSQVRGRLYLLFGAVGFVLLIACANVANLLLVRANARRREIAIRASLGAGRFRIVRQLLTESVMLSLAGGILGLGLGFLGMRSLLAVNTAGLPRLGEAGTLMGLDWRVVLFTLGLSVLTGILFGLVPALITSKTNLSSVIKDASSQSGSGFSQNKTRSILVVAELGLAVVLLVGAALLIRTSLALSAVDPGFNTTNVVTMRTSLSGQRYVRSAAVEELARNTLSRIRTIAGVEAAAASCCVPLQGGYGLPFNVIGRTNEGPGPFTGGTGIWMSTSDYFTAYEIPVVRGRAFTDRDDGAAEPVVIINQAAADQFWPDGDPLADRVLIGGGAANMSELAEEPIRQIVGIVGNVRANGIANDPGPIMYIPQAQMPDALNALNISIAPYAWIVRTRGDPMQLAGKIQEEIRAATGLPVTDVRSMDEVVALSTSRQRVNMLLMSVFGSSALLLAAIGVYGLMAFSVQQRTHEIGIRMALGAETGRVRSMVIRQGMLLVTVGVVVGLVAAFFLANVLSSIVFGVEPRDIAVFVGVPVLLTLIALAAVSVPAHRASLVDPLNALRYE